jgi:predicted ester cyclase
LTDTTVNGKVQEDWEQTDMLGLMQQLGVVPKLA